MNYKEKQDTIKHITLGVKEVFYYPYNEGKEPLPLRPISSFELDQCIHNSLKYAPKNISKFIMNYRLGLIKKTQNIDVSDEGYANLEKYYDRLDYWIVYYSMKDFQDEWFQEPDYNTEEVHPKGYYIVLQMNEVHEIAQYIINSSHRTKEVIEELFLDEEGREVGYLYFYLNVPLAEISEMTSLQRNYLIYAKGQLRKIEAGKGKEFRYMFSGKKMTMKEFLDQMGVSY